MNNLEVIIDEEIISFVSEKLPNNKCNLKDKIYEIVKFLLKEEKINMPNVSVTISRETEEGIRVLNREYRNVDKMTDVLSFPIFEKTEIEEILAEKDENKKIQQLELGDIILCMEVIERQSVEYETGLLRETLYMITHGMCHLLGYDHIEDDDKVVMRALEKKVLSEIGVEKYEK